MNNTQQQGIFSISPNANFDTKHRNHDLNNESLFNTYLSNKFQQQVAITLSPSFVDEEEESDSSSSSCSKASTACHQNQYQKKITKTTRKSKNHKKQDSIDSDNDSLDDYKPKLSNNNNNNKTKKSSSSDQVGIDIKKQPAQKSLYKTELCRNWEETNHCRYGLKCQYAHGAADLREIDRHPKYKTQKCRTFHQTGACPYGARCTFRHFHLPGDALEMKKLEEEEEAEVVSSLLPFNTQQQQQQHWYLNKQPFITTSLDGVLRHHQKTTFVDTAITEEDLFLPSNAESLLPHQLLFDLESPDNNNELEQVRRCPLRNYVNLPSFSHPTPPPPYHHQQQQQHYQQQQQQQLDQQCNTFFHPWLF